MKRLLPALAILAFLILPQAAQAQVFFEQQIPKIDKIFVVYENHVEDDCLPSSSILKVEAELILRDPTSPSPKKTMELRMFC